MRGARSRATRRGRAISVVVCSYNGARTIRDCLDGPARASTTRDFEVIVVDDGSTDATAAIAREYDVRLISTPNRGPERRPQHRARAATGEIVAYIDDDAYPDPHWLQLPRGRRSCAPTHVGVGGPNIAAARRRARSPTAWPTRRAADPRAAHRHGGRAHPRLQHGVPPERAARRSAASIRSSATPATTSTSAGGCRSAAGRSASARRRWSGITAATRCARYWRQQRGYGQAEALLERKWPERYNARRPPRAGRAGSTGRGSLRRFRGVRERHLPGHLGHGAVPVALRAGAGDCSPRCR